MQCSKPRPTGFAKDPSPLRFNLTRNNRRRGNPLEHQKSTCELGLSYHQFLLTRRLRFRPILVNSLIYPINGLGTPSFLYKPDFSNSTLIFPIPGLTSLSMGVGVMEKALYSSYTLILLAVVIATGTLANNKGEIPTTTRRLVLSGRWRGSSRR